MPSVITLDHRQGRPSGVRGVSPGLIVAGIITAAAFLFVGTALPNPHFVAHITFVNPTRYDLSIDATPSSHDGWMGVGYAEHNRTSTVQDVYDIGPVWVLRFHGQGETAGELTVTRTELERQRWTVQIPRWVGDALRARGAPITP